MQYRFALKYLTEMLCFLRFSMMEVEKSTPQVLEAIWYYSENLNDLLLKKLHLDQSYIFKPDLAKIPLLLAQETEKIESLLPPSFFIRT